MLLKKENCVGRRNRKAMMRGGNKSYMTTEMRLDSVFMQDLVQIKSAYKVDLLKQALFAFL